MRSLLRVSQNNIIQVEGLVKVYPGGVKVLSGIDFSVGRDEFFGFLGPNGAGKSTTIKILSTLLSPQLRSRITTR
ncbi:MAG: ATP-binding cassette domain-containing protein [SAR202 cluster bacterium]|nr:hypothetical protein [Chloroflexota bacterium]MQG47905.1 ATP-binding cassette domain-containing protein [SAR202 cluster bacterium]MQG77636.1 ATP-binding cassette domain-containing protein [SAR202 cluster bacterium]